MSRKKEGNGTGKLGKAKEFSNFSSSAVGIKEAWITGPYWNWKNTN